MIKKDDQIIHTGVPGMKWGQRRHQSAARATARDAADLRKHGFKKEAAAVQKVSNKEAKKAKIIKAAIKSTSSKRMSFVEREQKRRDVTNQLVKRVMRVVGALLVLDVVSGIGSTSENGN